jgi:hypothetical protein
MASNGNRVPECNTSMTAGMTRGNGKRMDEDRTRIDKTISTTTNNLRAATVMGLRRETLAIRSGTARSSMPSRAVMMANNTITTTAMLNLHVGIGSISQEHPKTNINMMSDIAPMANTALLVRSIATRKVEDLLETAHSLQRLRRNRSVRSLPQLSVTSADRS